jgi:hypothetical protein
MSEGNIRPSTRSMIKVNQKYGRTFMIFTPKNPFKKGSDEPAASRESQSRP